MQNNYVRGVRNISTKSNEDRGGRDSLVVIGVQFDDDQVRHVWYVMRTAERVVV